MQRICLKSRRQRLHSGSECYNLYSVLDVHKTLLKSTFPVYVLWKLNMVLKFVLVRKFGCEFVTFCAFGTNEFSQENGLLTKALCT